MRALLLLTVAPVLLAQQYARNPGVPWPATDGLGRTLPLAAEVGPPRPERFVGIFYFLWLGQHDHSPQGPFLVTDILKRFPDALKSESSPPWGPPGTPHWWGEPQHGFYIGTDPWVLRRHAWMLADAGVDTLIFDTTNRITYRDVYFKLLATFRQIRAEGGRTPQIVFMTNTEAGPTSQELYEDLYQPGLYEDLWFRWQGKPLLICDPEKAGAEVKAFFTLRRAHWPFTQVNTKNAWHWESAYPQVYGFTDDPNRPEMVNVAVAQNLRISDGKVTDMSNGDARGRSFHNGARDTTPGAVNQGFNFQEQWKRALELSPPFVMVTGWNEWVAGRYTRPGKPTVFVDQFDEEHSRDIEPMRGGHLDHYYYQLVANIRRYKGVPAIRPAAGARTIPLDSGFSAWRDVMPEFRDHIGETIPRDSAGIGSHRYTNKTGLNDFELLKVARNRDTVYFYARTVDPVQKPGNGRMMLAVNDTYTINRSAAGLLERRTGDTWQRVAEVPMRVQGNELYFAIPRSALGVPAGGFTLDFQWLDTPTPTLDPVDSCVNGDAAPEGRFRYRFIANN